MDVEALVDSINAADRPRAVLYLAGGGTEVLPMLLGRGGGSNTLLSARVPYDPGEFRALIGADPGRLVDARAARGLAMAAFRHALSLRGDLPADQVFGLGATSKLTRGQGERPGRVHEVHAALQADRRTVVLSLTFPGGLDRPGQERINALLLLNLLAEGKGVDGRVPLEAGGRPIATSRVEVAADDCRHDGLSGLFTDGVRFVSIDFDGEAGFGPAPVDAELPRLLLPGSFRPLHDGHLAMASAAAKLTGLPCGFELSLFHPEKPPLDYVAIRSRLAGFEGRACRLVFTHAPTYLDKARLFPGCTFAVGQDTARRIVDPRFYGGESGLARALGELEGLGTRFLVFGRVDDSGRFEEFSPEAFNPPTSGFLARVATPVPESVFRLDLSSTRIRAEGGNIFA